MRRGGIAFRRVQAGPDGFDLRQGICRTSWVVNMKRLGCIAICAFSGLWALQAGPTAPVNPAERNETFAPETHAADQPSKQPKTQKMTPPTQPVQATVNKTPASVAGREAAIERAPVAKTMAPTAPINHPTVQTAPSKVTVVTGGQTLLRPQDYPVRSKAGTKFQNALNEARAASAARAEQYRKEAKVEKKDAKLDKVNEFVPTAPAPGQAIRAGSETSKSPTP